MEKLLLSSAGNFAGLDQRTWPKLGFFALVHPDGDILPVRAVYGDVSGDQTNIGLNPLNSAKPIWFKTSGPKAQPLSGAPSPEAAPMISITEVARGKDRPTLLAFLPITGSANSNTIGGCSSI